jgi:hypothetical protein
VTASPTSRAAVENNTTGRFGVWDVEAVLTPADARQVPALHERTGRDAALCGTLVVRIEAQAGLDVRHFELSMPIAMRLSKPGARLVKQRLLEGIKWRASQELPDGTLPPPWGVEAVERAILDTSPYGIAFYSATPIIRAPSVEHDLTGRRDPTQLHHNSHDGHGHHGQHGHHGHHGHGKGQGGSNSQRGSTPPAKSVGGDTAGTVARAPLSGAEAIFAAASGSRPREPQQQQQQQQEQQRKQSGTTDNNSQSTKEEKRGKRHRRRSDAGTDRGARPPSSGGVKRIVADAADSSS